MRRGIAIAAATVLIAAVLVATLLVACGSDEAPPSFDRSRIVVATSREVIAPAYAAFADRAAALEAATRAWAADPTAEGLEAVRRAWREARAAWKRTEPFDFGPAEDAHATSNLDFWPAMPERVEAQLAESRPLEELGAPARGFPALEYLLFGPGSDAPDARRCEYAVALAGEIRKDAELLRREWGGPYGEALATAGSGSRIYPKLQAGIDAIVRRMIVLVRKIADRKLGRPMGRRSGGTPEPAAVESRFADASADDMLANLEGLEGLYSRGGFAEFLEATDPDLDARIRSAIDGAAAAIRAIDGPLSRAVESDRPTVEAAFGAVKALERVLDVDLKGRLGCQFVVNDLDGD